MKRDKNGLVYPLLRNEISLFLTPHMKLKKNANDFFVLSPVDYKIRCLVELFLLSSFGPFLCHLDGPGLWLAIWFEELSDVKDGGPVLADLSLIKIFLGLSVFPFEDQHVALCDFGVWNVLICRH